MLNKKYSRLFSLFIGSSGYLVPFPRNEYSPISKTLHPFLLGKRNIYYFYDLEKSLYGIRATIEVLKNIIASEGKILFIGNEVSMQSRFKQDSNINFLKCKRGSITKSKDADLVFLTSVEKENLVEAHRKCLLLVGVGSSTMSKISYPFNLNIESPFLSDWFFGTMYTSCVQGKRMVKGSKKKNQIVSLLGKGPRVASKNFNKDEV
uniref:Ribosomal protein S2 n=1 Tax=Ectocarpus siliculosus TaxID=2880 RepID=A0A5K1KEM3_ECTSI|nr:ribosomal protein S2 [Ectocarpus siliculosus]